MNTEADKKILLLFIRYQINENPDHVVSTKKIPTNGNPALINQEEDT